MDALLKPTSFEKISKNTKLLNIKKNRLLRDSYVNIMEKSKNSRQSDWDLQQLQFLFHRKTKRSTTLQTKFQYFSQTSLRRYHKSNDKMNTLKKWFSSLKTL